MWQLNTFQRINASLMFLYTYLQAIILHLPQYARDARRRRRLIVSLGFLQIEESPPSSSVLRVIFLRKETSRARINLRITLRDPLYGPIPLSLPLSVPLSLVGSSGRSGKGNFSHTIAINAKLFCSPTDRATDRRASDCPDEER